MGFGNPIIGGAAALIRAAIRSPNYVAGLAGWSINRDGTFDLVGGTFRGTITLTLANGTILVINGNYIQFFKPDGVTAVGLIQPMDPVNGGLAVFGQNGPASSALYLIADANGSVVTPGQLVANEPGQVAGTPEVWHSLGTAGATGCTLNQGRYRKTADGETEIDIALTAGAGGSTAGTYTWSNTLPAAYQFTGNYSRAYSMGYVDPVSAGAENPAIAVDGAGTATPGRVRMFLPAFGANTLFTVSQRIPLN